MGRNDLILYHRPLPSLPEYISLGSCGIQHFMLLFRDTQSWELSY
jgi:hypothetical protein